MQVGVDEVGLGSLAGPLVVGAVVLDNARDIEGLRDSKKVSARVRDKISQEIFDQALFWSIGIATKKRGRGNECSGSIASGNATGYI